MFPNKFNRVVLVRPVLISTIMGSITQSNNANVNNILRFMRANVSHKNTSWFAHTGKYYKTLIGDTFPQQCFAGRGRLTWYGHIIRRDEG